MAEGFAADADKAQQLGDRLTSIARTIEGMPPGPRPSGPLGSGVLEQAWSNFERSVATAKQNLAKSVNKSAGGFGALARGTTRNDQEQSRQAQQEIGTV